jgi:hypothetical protein
MIENFIGLTVESFEKYYGFDWLAMILTFYSIKFLKDKSKAGFALGASASLAWLAFNYLVMSIAGIIANLFFIYMHVKGFISWQKDEEENLVNK